MITTKNIYTYLLAIISFTGLIQADDKKDAPPLMMIEQGKVILSTGFDEDDTLDKSNFQTRKDTAHEVTNGVMKVTPPSLDKSKAGTKNGESHFARIAFHKIIPQDYAIRFRFKINQPEEGTKAAKRATLFCEFAHRHIRIETSPTESSLLLMNHLLKGQNPDTRPPEICHENKEFALEYDQWHWFYGEIKDDEILVRINDETFYGKDSEIAKERPESFQINNYGVGFELDDLTIWEAGNFSEDWKEKRESLTK